MAQNGVNKRFKCLNWWTKRFRAGAAALVAAGTVRPTMLADTMVPEAFEEANAWGSAWVPLQYSPVAKSSVMFSRVRVARLTVAAPSMGPSVPKVSGRSSASSFCPGCKSNAEGSVALREESDDRYV